MWLVKKGGTGIELTRERVPDEDAVALLRWYSGGNRRGDEMVGVRIVQRAKMFDRWIACDCLGDEARPPILSPAYLTEAETYYLRRLTGEGRTEHRTDCPFYRPQTLPADAEQTAGMGATPRPDGYFAILKPKLEHLAQRPVEGDRQRTRTQSQPRIARLLWRLMERAELNVMAAPGNRPEVSIRAEFDRLKAASSSLEIAPNEPLAPLLVTHPKGVHSRELRARMEEAAIRWPAAFAPQAFAVLYAKQVRGREVIVPASEPIVVATEVRRPAGFTSSDGPFLTLIAIGEHATNSWAMPVSAYAQPVFDGRRFFPVDRAWERSAVLVILRVQSWLQSERDVSIIVRKSLFDETEDGTARGAFCIEIFDHSYGAMANLTLSLTDEREDFPTAQATVTLTRGDVEDGREGFRILARAIMTIVERQRSRRLAPSGRQAVMNATMERQR